MMQDLGRLGDFIKGRKEFVLEGAKISMVRDDTTLKPLSVANQLEEILREHGPTMEVTALCSKFIQKFHVSVANVVQMRPMDFIMQEKEKFAMIGASSVTLKEFESKEKAKVAGSSLRMARSKSPQVRAGGWERSVVVRVCVAFGAGRHEYGSLNTRGAVQLVRELVEPLRIGLALRSPAPSARARRLAPFSRRRSSRTMRCTLAGLVGACEQQE